MTKPTQDQMQAVYEHTREMARITQAIREITAPLKEERKAHADAIAGILAEDPRQLKMDGVGT